ncbi:hypothetical protein SAMN05877809_102633 [Rhodobacter sp. JA431]|uniref:hypothetical protein n=1 Tax=Rhodobacter sp. JA431 TaxID=570013 RepID=UPI000BDA8612|nr:hypothetical protein [Rhodobacter sp. JA431]SOC00529.1 hypothetical protein SAMN05877809_102633 [Rhodobacter sp. JA431]
MSDKITLEGQDYEIAHLSTGGQALAKQIAQVQHHLDERMRMREVLLKARAAYLAELRAEVVKQQSGVDLSRLLDDI